MIKAVMCRRPLIEKGSFLCNGQISQHNDMCPFTLRLCFPDLDGMETQDKEMERDRDQYVEGFKLCMAYYFYTDKKTRTGDNSISFFFPLLFLSGTVRANRGLRRTL